MVSISVIICTYNPNPSIFLKCLDKVRSASAVYPPHETIIIDNNSSQPLHTVEYINTFIQTLPNARIVREAEQGLTPSRLRGIRESTGDILIFVDDDNLISTSYFLMAAKISKSHPFIGAFSGQVTIQYDQEPEEWTKRYWGMLIHRKVTNDVWSNLPFNGETMPYGAGLCVSRDTATHYLHLSESGKRKFNLDRSKESLLSGGDNDLAMCACDIGKGMGLFKDLELEHYVPPKRFTLPYLKDLTYGIYFSHAVLLYMREGKIDNATVKKKIKTLVLMSMMKSKDRVILRSALRGARDGAAFIKSNKQLF